MKLITSSSPQTSAFAALLAGITVQAPKPGAIVDGEIIAATRGGFIVSIGTKSDAFLSHNECAEDAKIGDKGRFIVLGESETDEEFTLSQKRVVAADRRNLAWEKIIGCAHTGAITHATVTRLTFAKHNDHFCGAEATIDGITCFIPRRELVCTGDPKSLVDTEIPVKVTKCDREVGRFGDVVLSQVKAVNDRKRDFLLTLKPRTLVKGTVARILAEEKGVLVDLGETMALLPRLDLSHNRGARVASLVRVGDEIECEVTRVNLDKLSVHLSRIGATFKTLRLGEVVEGEVSNVTDFGAFVTLNGCVDGLLHATELCGGSLSDFKPGSKVAVRIKSIDAARNRVALTRVGVSSH